MMVEFTVGEYRFSVERRPVSRAELVRRYDALAKGWQNLIARLGFNRAYRSLIAEIKTRGFLTEKAAAQQVLDIGVGAGDLSLALQEKIYGRLDLFGIDISPAMVGVAQTVLPNGRFQVAEATSLPFADHQFDLVICAHVLEHLPDPAEGLKEMVRVVKPGGTIVLVITCRGMWGWWIRHKWGTQLVGRRQLQEWIQQQGFQSADILPVGQKVGYWEASLALVGRIAGTDR